MRQAVYLLLLLVSLSAQGQLHEILITDTAHIDYRVLEDSSIDFSFKHRKNMKGHWIVYYDESKKKKAMEAAFKRGKLAGTEKQWYDSGRLKTESSNVEDTSMWTYKKWYPDGNIYSERKCVNDTCTIEYYYSGGVLMERDIQAFDVKGVRNWFYSVTFCDNGQAKFSPALNPDSPDPQLITTFYCNGSRKAEFTLLQVKNEFLRIGYYTEWYEDGGLKIQGLYDDSGPGGAGKKIGTWHYYNNEKTVIKLEEYENGKLIEKHQH